MYRALFLGLVLASGMLWAGAPMDLDSPFVKTALIKKSWTEDSINTMRERVFLEDVWGKGKKEVKYFGVKMDCLE